VAVPDLPVCYHCYGAARVRRAAISTQRRAQTTKSKGPGRGGRGRALAPGSRRLGRDGGEPGAHALSQLSSRTNSYSYDDNGNLRAKDGAVFTWDFKDRLVSVEDAKMRTEYRYDYKHRRICKQVMPKPGTEPKCVRKAASSAARRRTRNRVWPS